VAISFEGRVDSALQFLCYAPGVYKPSDMLVARRIADRLALALSRERREQALVRADEAVARAERLESRVQALTEELNARAGFRRVIGQSASWREVLTQATQVRRRDVRCCCWASRGRARKSSRASSTRVARSGRPFVALELRGAAEQLLEAELFGYERGAFTGATQSKPGRLEQAAGGTLFLDEVGEMSPAAQAKFLRVLQEREFQRSAGRGC
jgi:Nif-specific regulatory protein